jgi:hypothetical protein
MKLKATTRNTEKTEVKSSRRSKVAEKYRVYFEIVLRLAALSGFRNGIAALRHQQGEEHLAEAEHQTEEDEGKPEDISSNLRMEESVSEAQTKRQ